MISRRDLVRMVGASAALAGLSACGQPVSRYRQKMSVEVESPSGLRTGSSVIEVGFKTKPDFLRAIPGNGFFMRGEAVVVDLGSDRSLFALICPPPEMGGDVAWYQAMLFRDAILAGALVEPPLALPDGGLSFEAHEAIGRSRAKLVLPPQLYPLLVTFTEPHDANSVVQINPQDLEATFGTGVRLKAITLQITDEEVTTGLERRLAAMGIGEGDGLDKTGGVSAHPTLAQRLGYHEFVRR